MSLALRFFPQPNGCPGGQRLTHLQMHCIIVTLTRESGFPNDAVQAWRYRWRLTLVNSPETWRIALLFNDKKTHSSRRKKK
jgi:hypothetical protein